MPHLTVCADASTETGYGHLFRSMLVGGICRDRHGLRLRALLAEHHDPDPLTKAGIEFVKRPGTMAERILASTEPDEGPVLIDSYSVTADDLSRLRQSGFRIAMFDDGNRLSTYDVDLLIDSAPGAEAFGYRGVGEVRFLLGPRYFPLRDEFLRPLPSAEQSVPGRVVVTFGGSDPDDATAIAFDALADDAGMQQTYVLGPGYKGRLLTEPSTPGRKIVRNTDHMAEVLSEAEVVLSAGGGTALEAASLGKPTAIVVLSADQRHMARNLENAGVSVVVGDQSNGAPVDSATMLQAIRTLMADPVQRQEMSRRAACMVDGKGAPRIAKAIAGLT